MILSDSRTATVIGGSRALGERKDKKRKRKGGVSWIQERRKREEEWEATVRVRILVDAKEFITGLLKRQKRPLFVVVSYISISPQTSQKSDQRPMFLCAKEWKEIWHLSTGSIQQARSLECLQRSSRRMVSCRGRSYAQKSRK